MVGGGNRNEPNGAPLGILQNGRTLNDYKYLVQSREAMFDHLVWWGEVLKAGRQRTAAERGRAA